MSAAQKGGRLATTVTRRSLSRRVFGTIFSVAMLVVVVFSLVGTAYVQGQLVRLAHDELENQIDFITATLNSTSDDTSILHNLSQQNTRITLIDADGTVLYDTEADADGMVNHLSRPEVAQALETGRGSSERASSTLGEVMLYEAVRLDDGSEVPLSRSRVTETRQELMRYVREDQ